VKVARQLRRRSSGVRARDAPARHLALERLEAAPEILQRRTRPISAVMAVAHHGVEQRQHDSRLVDPIPEALVVGRGSGRDLETSVDDMSLLEDPPASDHVAALYDDP